MKSIHTTAGGDQLQMSFGQRRDPTWQGSVKISELPRNEQPIYRILNSGPGISSVAELLSIILGLPTMRQAQQLLVEYGGITGIARAPISELTRIPGIGPKKAATLKAALELGRRLLVATPSEKPQIKSPADAANLLMADMGVLEQEHLVTVILDSKNHVLKIHTVYIGSLNTAVMRIGELFREAIRMNAAAVIVAHNHPSGDPTPSADDVHSTSQIVEAGKLLNIDVLDHIVVGQQRWVSLKERGLGF